MKFISKFNHDFTNPSCLYYAILKDLYSFKGKRAHKTRDKHVFFQNGQNESFKILKMFKNNHTHDILILSLLSVITMVELLKVFNAMELHFLISLKVNCSSTACSSSIRPIFNKKSQYKW